MLQFRKNIVFLCCCLIFLSKFAHADTIPITDTAINQSSGYKKKIIIFESVCYLLTYSALWQSWYSKYPHSSFHWFNDNAEWMQVDKLSHCNTSYWLTKANIASLQTAGYNQVQSRNIAAGGAFISMASIEFMDGFSREWGASWGDLLANSVGISLAYFQNVTSREALFQLKFSYWPSPYRTMRPEVLGDNSFQGMIKDYNGHRHWLSCNLNQAGLTAMPQWFNLAIGYGARGMTGGRNNALGTIEDNERMRSFYLSPDLYLPHFHPRRKWLKIVCTTLQWIKIPAPALEINRHGLHWWWFTF